MLLTVRGRWLNSLFKPAHLMFQSKCHTSKFLNDRKFITMPTEWIIYVFQERLKEGELPLCNIQWSESLHVEMHENYTNRSIKF